MISFVSLFKIFHVAVPDPNIFLWIAASVAHAAAVNPNGVITLLANGLSIFSIRGNTIFSNGPKSLPKNPPGYQILCNWAFNNFILADEPFAKTLRNFETCVLVNNNLCRELFSSLESPTTFDEISKLFQYYFYMIAMGVEPTTT